MPNYIGNTKKPLEILNCIAESMHQGISVIDEELNIILVNETAQRMLEVPYALLEKDPTLAGVFRYNAERGDYGPGDPVEQVAKRIDLARKFEPHDFTRTRPDGTSIRIQGTPIENGGYVTVYTDVTLQMAQEAELLAAQTSLEEALDEQTKKVEFNRDLLLDAVNCIEDGISIVDPQGRVTLVNETIRSVYPNVETLMEQGAKVGEVIQTIFPDDPERNLEDMLGSEEMWTERKFPDGRWFKIKRSRTSNGGMIAVYSDVTSYKKQQATLQDHANVLVRHLRHEKKLTEMQREFVSMASHEFRTPLAIIDSNAQRLKRRIDTLEPAKVIERLDRIRDSVETMQYLINQFLNFSQTNSVGIEVNLAVGSLRDVAAAIASRQQELTKRHKIHLDLDALPNEIQLDKRMIEQCLSNIMSNAVKYSPGKTDVFVRGWTEDRFAVLSVKDEGIGIPKDEISKVFNRYFRASTSSGIPGTGIGLNLTEMIIQKHKGRVEVDSELGKGTCVTLRLPLMRSGAQAGGEAKTAACQTNGSSQEHVL